MARTCEPVLCSPRLKFYRSVGECRDELLDESVKLYADAKVMKYLGFIRGMDRERCAARLAWRESRGGNSLLIKTNYEGKNIGICGFNSIIDGEAEFGLAIHSEFWRKGYSTEIHLICFEDAFRSGMVKKIIMETNENNQAMRGFCEKIGMTLEKMIPEATCVDGVYSTDALYVLTIENWDISRGILQAMLDKSLEADK